MDGVVAPLDKICDLADKYDVDLWLTNVTGQLWSNWKGTLEAKV
jgi:glycine C-acetyltransferase